MTTTFTAFNSIQGNAYDRGVTTHDQDAHTLMLASYDEDTRLIMNGVDTRPGLQMVATGLVGGTSERLNTVGFTGHHMSIKRINGELSHINPMYRLHKLGEVVHYGFGRQQLKKIEENPAIYSGYTTRGRAVYVPTELTPDGITARPRILYSTDFLDVTKVLFADSDHCRQEDWPDLVREFQGLFLLLLIQQNRRSGDKRKWFGRRLAKLFREDKEAAIFLWTQKLATSGIEKAFA